MWKISVNSCSAIELQHPQYYITAWKVAIAGLTIKDQHPICLNLQREHRKAKPHKPEFICFPMQQLEE